MIINTNTKIQMGNNKRWTILTKDTQMSNKHMERCPISLMPIKTIIWCYYKLSSRDHVKKKMQCIDHVWSKNCAVLLLTSHSNYSKWLK